MIRKNLLLVLISVAFLTGCLAGKPVQNDLNDNPGQPTSNSEASSSSSSWPTDGWQVSEPEAQGMKGDMLGQMLDYIAQQKLELHSLLVIRNGFLISETYFGNYHQGQKHEIYSCTKSFIATLVGIAIQQGYIRDITDQAVSFFPDKLFQNNNDSKQAMTLENLLTMTSGLAWEEGDVAYRALYLSNDWIKQVMDLPMSEAPGERFNYCTGCSHVLSGIIRQQTGSATHQYAEEHLFGWLGITDYVWAMDSTGNAIGGWGLQLTSQQMAKLGYLYLHKGYWDGHQVVPEAWVEQAVLTHVETGDGDAGYGYQWWILPSLDGYAALGMKGQMIFVAPDLDLVVVTTANMDGHEAIFHLLDQYILPAAR